MLLAGKLLRAQSNLTTILKINAHPETRTSRKTRKSRIKLFSARVATQNMSSWHEFPVVDIWSLAADKMSSQTMMVMLGSMLAISKVLWTFVSMNRRCINWRVGFSGSWILTINKISILLGLVSALHGAKLALQCWCCRCFEPNNSTGFYSVYCLVAYFWIYNTVNKKRDKTIFQLSPALNGNPDGM